MSVADLGGQFALDLQGVQRLKQTASRDPAAALQGASKQFEALFLQMMLKSMREASPQSGLLDSEQSRFYTSLLDQQWAQQLAGNGLGLAEQLVQQLKSQPGLAAAQAGGVAGDALLAGIPRGTPRPLHGAGPVDSAAGIERLASAIGSAARFAAKGGVMSGFGSVPAAEHGASESRPAHVESFVNRMQASAEAASSASGVPAQLILAQAALETGWGRHQIASAGGGSSHNLFGIKAGAGWEGPTTEVRTTEYVDGQAQVRVERFRVYESYEAAFTDYARMMVNNPRYAGVAAAPDAQQAARALQRGGYATDPAYADKLIAVMATLAPTDSSRQVAQL